VPVCSPGLKKELGAAADAKLLAQARLIHITSVANDWSHWFRVSGMEVPSSFLGGLSVDTVQMGFDAAVRGLGVVLGRRPLVDDDIESGRLVPLAGQAIASDSGYWLVTPQTDFQKPEVKLFKRWLLSELGAATKSARPGSARRPKSQPLPTAHSGRTPSSRMR